MRRLLFLVLALCAFVFANAQAYEPPVAYKLDTAEDFAAYEADVLSCIRWILETPANDEPVKRANANGFLVNWLTGVPYLKLELRSEMIGFTEKSPQLLVVFLAGWAQEALTSRQFDDMYAGNLAGIEAVLAYYSKNRNQLSRDKKIERFARLQRKGKLEDYVAGVVAR